MSKVAQNQKKVNKKTIYLIRHGETDYNKQGIVQGSGIDSDLNETGIAQGRAFFEAYRSVTFDKIYTSALKRTVQTVQDFLELGIPHEKLSGLNEISWGIKEGGIPNYLEDEYYKKLIENWQNGHTHLACEGGESPEDVLQRQKEAVAKILENAHEKTILIAMHGRAIRILLCLLLEKSLHEMDAFEHSNVCLYLLTYDETTRTFELLKSNDTSHLISEA